MAADAAAAAARERQQQQGTRAMQQLENKHEEKILRSQKWSFLYNVSKFDRSIAQIGSRQKLVPLSLSLSLSYEEVTIRY